MPLPRAVREGDVVLVRARVTAVHEGQGLMAVEFALPRSWGGTGRRTEVLELTNVAAIEDDPPDDAALVPRFKPRR